MSQLPNNNERVYEFDIGEDRFKEIAPFGINSGRDVSFSADSYKSGESGNNFIVAPFNFTANIGEARHSRSFF